MKPVNKTRGEEFIYSGSDVFVAFEAFGKPVSQIDGFFCLGVSEF